MKSLLTIEELKSFEQRIADVYNASRIKAPVHLSGGNEEKLIEIFKGINEEDWVFSTWRSHYHCLLKGVPLDVLERDIFEGRSITLNYPEQRIVTSAIVAAILPQAAGVALGIQLRGGTEKVYCFIGDMTSRTGIYYETFQYVCGHDLPLQIIIEDNGKSVGTPTKEVWGKIISFERGMEVVFKYEYELPWPHAGAGQWVKF